MENTPLLHSNLPPLPGDSVPCRHGKVRDVYDLGDTLLLVSTDRISAYDWVMPNGIPDKGRLLTELSTFWFDLLAESDLGIANHLLETDVHEMGFPDGADLEPLAGRTVMVRKTEVVPIECVVRGYLSGSGWKEYQETQTVCGVKLPAGLVESDQLPEPIFTPASKAEQGDHDENITFEQMREKVGRELSEELREKSIAIYKRGAQHAGEKGIILADTKFEFGHHDGELFLIDEALTPDSSRFWPADQYSPGKGQRSYDKQFVRDWLTQSGWDKNSPPPELPDEVVEKTRAKYVEAYELLTGSEFGW
ncbi:MAG: phosphoribosylaminoimidazolesuccinocarboxamide synthase [Lacipirellulaceae bacterium]